jgi:hypothetical protein
MVIDEFRFAKQQSNQICGERAMHWTVSPKKVKLGLVVDHLRISRSIRARLMLQLRRKAASWISQIKY